MNTSQELIMYELKSLKKDDKVDTIKAHLESVVKCFVEYQYATQIYGIATLLEVQMRNVTDPDELTTFRTQINKRVDQYKTDREETERTIEKYLDQTHVLNDRSALQWITSSLAAVLPTSVGGLFGVAKAPKIFSLVDGLFTDHQKAQKTEILQKSRSEFAPLRDTTLLDSPASSINRYIDTVGREIEYVKIGEEYYTNLPES